MTSKINKDIFSQNFHWNAMFGCIKKYMTCGSKIGRLQSQKNITMLDRKGVIYRGRDNLNQWKSAHAVETNNRTFYVHS